MPALDRTEFEKLVQSTAYWPRTSEAIRTELGLQLRYQPDAAAEGLDELASALTATMANGGDPAAAAFTALARKFPKQPLCQFYRLAAARQAADTTRELEALDALVNIDPGDPIVELMQHHLAGKPTPAVSENVRMANIAKLAATPLLRRPYRRAIGAIFEAIRDRKQVRVLDVGVGSGAQICELLGLLAAERHDVRRLEVVGLDFVDDFLHAAGESICARAAGLNRPLEVSYLPVRGQVEALDDETVGRIGEGGPIDAANATIALHEVPGEAKLEALANLRRLAPRRFVLAEWNYCLENVLAERSIVFLFNVRRVVTAMVSALRENYPLEEARAVARDWLCLGAGQLTCPAEERQECFLDVGTWRALLEVSGFGVEAELDVDQPIALIEASAG